jgi:GAF domain-containing protein
VADEDLAGSFAALDKFVISEHSLRESLHAVAELSVRAVYGADGAGVTLLADREPLTVTAAGDFVRRVDEIQYTLGEGPCLEAYSRQTVVVVGDFLQETRWPRFTQAALVHGLRAVIALPLTVHGGQLGTLNIYALQPGVFDEEAAKTAMLFSQHASVVLANAEAFSRARDQAVNLGEALSSRAVIDMAKGIIMAREGATPDDAFGRLREISQSTHQKLRDVAQDLVDSITSEGGDQPSGD